MKARSNGSSSSSHLFTYIKRSDTYHSPSPKKLYCSTNTTQPYASPCTSVHKTSRNTTTLSLSLPQKASPITLLNTSYKPYNSSPPNHNLTSSCHSTNSTRHSRSLTFSSVSTPSDKLFKTCRPESVICLNCPTIISAVFTTSELSWKFTNRSSARQSQMWIRPLKKVKITFQSIST